MKTNLFKLTNEQTASELGFSFATIEYNNYYKGYTVWVETSAYHYGLLADVYQSIRDENHFLLQNSFDVITFETLQEASDWAKFNGLEVVTRKVIYHVTEGVKYININ